MDGTENNLVNLPEIIIDNIENPEYLIKNSNNNLESAESNNFIQKTLTFYSNKDMRIDDYFN